MEHYTEQNPISVQPCTLTRVKEMESENGKGAASSDTGETAVWCLYRWKPHSKKDWRHEEGVDTGGVFDYSYFSNNLSDTFLRGIKKKLIVCVKLMLTHLSDSLEVLLLYPCIQAFNKHKC